MIVLDAQERVKSFILSLGIPAPEGGIYFGWEREGQLTGGMGFRNYTEDSIEGCLALSEGRMPRHFLNLFLWYPFGQLKVKRLTFYITASNLKSINFVTKLGAYREATLPDGSADGDVYIYSLHPERCPLWRKS